MSGGDEELPSLLPLLLLLHAATAIEREKILRSRKPYNVHPTLILTFPPNRILQVNGKVLRVM
jgi:hypothetical protein